MNQIKKTIFREYDLRGKVLEELNKDTCRLIGKGFGTLLKQKGVNESIVGYDARSYSPWIKDSLIEGLLSTGINIVEVGQVLSPIAYFSQFHLQVKGLAMVTASHNPNGWSGFKLGYNYGSTLLPDDIKELYKIIIKKKFKKGHGQRKEYRDIINDYSDFLVKKVKIKRPIKVLVNAGNGTAGPIVPPILEKAGCQVVKQNCNLDFSFPHHEPDPASVKMLKIMGVKVKESGAEIGIGFDGDGDRLGVVDEKANIIWPDKFMILLVRQVLKEKPNSKIVFDVKCSQALIEEIEKNGGIPVMWKTGHSYIKQKAKDIDAALAGERSGHIFYRHDYYGYDDATFSALKLLEYLSSQSKPLSKIMKGIPQYFTSPTWHAECPDKVKYKIVDQLVEDFKKEYGEEKVIDINGARVLFNEGWGLVRASSNLPSLVLVFESKTKKGLNKIEDIFRKKVSQYKEVNKEWKD